MCFLFFILTWPLAKWHAKIQAALGPVGEKVGSLSKYTNSCGHLELIDSDCSSNTHHLLLLLIIINNRQPLSDQPSSYTYAKKLQVLWLINYVLKDIT